MVIQKKHGQKRIERQKIRRRILERLEDGFVITLSGAVFMLFKHWNDAEQDGTFVCASLSQQGAHKRYAWERSKAIAGRKG